MARLFVEATKNEVKKGLGLKRTEYFWTKYYSFIFGLKSSISNHAFLKIQITLSLLAGGGQSLEVGCTSLGNIGGLLGDEGSVGVGGEGGGDGSNSQVVAEEGVDVRGGGKAGDEVDRHLSFTLLPSGLGNSGEVSRTGLNNLSGLLGDEGTVGVSSEWGGDGGNGNMVAEEAEGRGGDVGSGSVAGDEVDGHLRFTLLPASLGNSGEVSGTSLNNVSGLGRHKGTVGVSSEGGNNGGDVAEETTEVGGVCVAGDQGDGDLSLALLTSVHNGTSGVHVGGTNEGVVATGGLGRVVVGGGGGHVRVEGGDGAVGVGDQVGGGVKHLRLPLAVVVDGEGNARSVDSEGVDQLASLGVGLQVGGGGSGIVGVIGGDGAIGVVHQLGRSTSNKERADYLKKAQVSGCALDGMGAPTQILVHHSLPTFLRLQFTVFLPL